MKIIRLFSICTVLGVLGISNAQGNGFAWQELGEATYTGNCTTCHQTDGGGLPDTFPPLTGHLPNVFKAEGGRAYLVQVLLYGLQGKIEVLSKSFDNAMPAWPQLSDEEIAAVLNHALTSWDNSALLPEDFSPFLPEEVAVERDKGLSAQDVLELRKSLGLDGAQ